MNFLKTRFFLILVFSGLFFTSCKVTKPVSHPNHKPKPRPTVVVKEKPVEEVPIDTSGKEVVTPQEPAPPVQIFKQSPGVPREFRAAWVATVANIDWPSKSGLSTAEQQKEAIKILDFLESHNYNAVILQVRPQADALYPSKLEPWSFFLTGVQGKAPNPYYDPLQFWIKEAHQRGIELHVWLNPFRAYHTTGGEINETSIVKKHPDWVVALKNGFYWLDPSKKAVQDHVMAVVKDIIERYDIDGVHFDDYFYPYASYNKKQDFPDSGSYSAYKAGGGKLETGDWRRENVNKFINRVYTEIKNEKPAILFGISPFGIYRPGSPASIQGMDQYSELYADAKLWLNKGWLDYLTPQLYWKINQKAQSFPVLLGWWKEQNLENRHLWPGIKLDYGGDADNTDEIINQIMITRGMMPKDKGAVQWSLTALFKNPELAKAILAGPYSKKALIPASPWLDKNLPSAPKVTYAVSGKNYQFHWEPNGNKEAFQWVIYYKYNELWEYKIFTSETEEVKLPIQINGYQLSEIGITAVDRSGNESSFKEIKINN